MEGGRRRKGGGGGVCGTEEAEEEEEEEEEGPGIHKASTEQHSPMVLAPQPGQLQCFRMAGCSACMARGESKLSRLAQCSQEERRTPARRLGTPRTSVSTPRKGLLL